MKFSSLIAGLGIGLIIGLILALLFVRDNRFTDFKHKAAQLADTTKWHWPDSLDAVKAAPQNHKVIFENDKIRILEVILRPYEYEQMHTHSFPSVMFGNNDTSSFDIIYYRYGYNAANNKYYITDSMKQHHGGDPVKHNKTSDYKDPEGPHRIKNLSNVKIDVFRVEFKPHL